MRVHSAAFFLTAFAATGASASSIQSLDPSAGTPSIVMLANTTVDPSIVEAAPLDGPTPSIIALADTPSGDTPDVLTLGGPAPADGGKPEDPHGMTMPMVIRGGETGQAYASPAPAQAAAPVTEPLLDPNDRGTPAKRNALKRQAERLAQEKAAAGGSGQQADPSDEAVPLGR
jgi:hypothetical protein